MKTTTCILIVLAAAAATAGAQSSFYHPLTLAPADPPTDTGGGALTGGTGPAVNSNSEAGAKSADEVAKELANPNNSLASLTFKNQFRWYTGDLPGADDQFNYTLLFQPVFPFPLEPTASGGKPNIFVRPAVPFLIDQPVFDAANGSFKGASGLGDIGFDLAYGVTEKNGLLWAVGMVGTLPTATDSAFAGKQLRLGPEVFLGVFEKWGVFGVFPSHQWNVAGWSDANYSTTQIQPFLRFLPGKGWNIGSTPIMDYNWESGEWTIPLQLSVRKTVAIGKTPVQLELEVNYYIDQPDAFGPKWMVGLNITPVVDNVINEWIHGK